MYDHSHDHDQQWFTMRFTMRSGVLSGNDTGGTAQVAAARCSPNERTLDPSLQLDKPNYSPASLHYGLHAVATTRLVFSNRYTTH